MKIIIKSVISIALISLIQGFVFMKMWAWFIVTTFVAPPINIVQAIGIMLAFSVFIQIKYEGNQVDEERELNMVWKNLWNYCSDPLYVLFLGWIVKLFM